MPQLISNLQPIARFFLYENPERRAVVVWFALLCGLLLIARSIAFVPKGYAYTLDRFGSYQRTLKSGWNWKLPLIERIHHRFSLNSVPISIPRQVVLTHDGLQLALEAKAEFSILNPKRAAHTKEGLETSIQELAQKVIRTLVKDFNTEKLLTDRQSIEDRARAFLNDTAHIFGVQIARFEFQQMTLPEALLERLGRQLQSERQANGLPLTQRKLHSPLPKTKSFIREPRLCPDGGKIPIRHT